MKFAFNTPPHAFHFSFCFAQSTELEERFNTLTHFNDPTPINIGLTLAFTFCPNNQSKEVRLLNKKLLHIFLLNRMQDGK